MKWLYQSTEPRVSPSQGLCVQSRSGMRLGRAGSGWVLGAGSWSGHTSTSCIPTFQRMQVPDRDRKGRFSCTGIMCFEVTEVEIKSSLKRWWRFPQLERGGSYKGSKSPFSPSSWPVPSGHCCPTCVSIPKREILSI